jgi:hypothetical protein
MQLPLAPVVTLHPRRKARETHVEQRRRVWFLDAQRREAALASTAAFLLSVAFVMAASGFAAYFYAQRTSGLL